MPKYTVEDIRKALDEVNRGSPIATAAAKYGIPRTTLSGKHHHVYPVEIRKGPTTVLTEEEEKHLENWIFHLSDVGFAITPDQLLDSVQHLVKELKRETPFTDGRPGRKWYKAYMKRHPEITKKLSRNLSHPRTLVTKENILNWFQEVRDYLTKENLLDVINEPTRVFNTDESGFFLCPKGDHVLVRKGSRMVFNFVMNDDKECLTALIGGNAAGDLMPPMVVFPYQRVPTVISELFPKTWAIGRSENGWMTSETFFEYVANIFHPWLIKEKIKLPVILFVDGHSSHGTLHLSEFCQKNQIVLIALYPNSTHFLQPMDVACFHPLKTGWKKGVRNWRFDNQGVRLKRENFAPLLEKVIGDWIKPETLVNGFRKCGLHPFTPQAINFEKMMVKSTAKDQDPNAQNGIQTVDDIDNQIFLKCIEKTISPELLHEFQSSGDKWTGSVEHKSLFDVWRIQCGKVRCENENTHANLTQSMNERDGNFQVVPNVGVCERENSASADDDEPTLILDYGNIPTVDLEEISQVDSQNIVIVYNSVEDGNLFGNEYYEQLMPVNELEVESEYFNAAGYHSDYSSSDDDFNVSKSSEPADSDLTSDFEEAVKRITIENTTLKEKIVGQSSINTDVAPHSIKEIGPDAEVNQETTSVNSSNIPSGTPAAFAKALFYPGEQQLSGKRKRSGKKQKIPAVYSSEQYSDYLRQKQQEKEALEKMKAQRKLKREQEKQKKEDEKKDREAKKLAKREATAIRNAELAAKKENLAMKKAEKTAKKAYDAAEKTRMKEGSSSGANAPKRKKQKKKNVQSENN